MSICSHEKQVLEREKEREGGGLCYVCIHTGPPSIIIPNTIPLRRFHKEMIYIMLITIIHCSLHYYNCRSTSAIYNRLNVIVIIIVITTNTTTTMNREHLTHHPPYSNERLFCPFRTRRLLVATAPRTILERPLLAPEQYNKEHGINECG